MNEVLPIGITSVDWNTHLSFARKQLGRSVTTSLDKVGKPVNTPSAFIITLAEAMAPTTEDHTAILRSASGLLRHVSASFLFSSDRDTLMEIIEATSLVCTRWSDKVTMVISGDMQEWVTNIKHFSCASVQKSVRELFNKATICFEQVGFAPLWSNCQKNQLQDKTFVLTEKL